MLQIERVTLSLAEGEDRLREKAAAILGLPAGEIQALTILRRAVDAREEVRLVYTLRVKVKNEERVLRRCGSRQVSRAEKERYRLPPPVEPPETAPPDAASPSPALRRVVSLVTSSTGKYSLIAMRASMFRS